MARLSHDTNLLQAALYGFQVEKEKIDARIRELQAQLKGVKAPAGAVKKAPAAGRRKMSAAARARIAAAQKKRWAEFHKKKTQSAGS